jgi:phage baseplate assembly protein W
LDKRLLISSVALCRKVKEFYNAAGDYEPRVTLIFLDITPLLDETQCSALAGEIMAEAMRRKAESTAELQEWARAAL